MEIESLNLKSSAIESDRKLCLSIISTTVSWIPVINYIKSYLKDVKLIKRIKKSINKSGKQSNKPRNVKSKFKPSRKEL